MSKKYSCKFPFKNQNTLTITFDKKPTLEDWQGVRDWLGFWGDNLVEEDDFQQVDSPDQNSRCVCAKCGQPHNYRVSKESGGEGSGRDSDLI